jgi:hypothetical protein
VLEGDADNSIRHTFTLKIGNSQTGDRNTSTSARSSLLSEWSGGFSRRCSTGNLGRSKLFAGLSWRTQEATAVFQSDLSSRSA